MGEAKLSLERLWVLMVSAFVDMVGFALILPLLPFYAGRYGADAFAVGLLIAAYAFAQLVSAPLWGRLSDRVGRRPVILGGQCLAAFAYVIFAFADSVWLLLACRLLQGAGGGTLGAISAYVSDAVGPEERAKGLGWITACTSAGVMVGPAIGSFSVRLSYAAPGLIAAVLCVLNVLFAWRWLPESSVRRHPGSRVPRRLRQAIGEVLRHPLQTVSALIWIYATGMMAFMALNGVMALFLAARFGITEENIGWFYVVVGLISVIMRAVVLGVLVRRFGEVRVLRLGALSLACGMGLAPLASHPLLFLLVVCCVPAGTALLFPSTTSLISRYSDPDEVGQTLGVQQAFGGVSRFLGPIWAGAVFQHAGVAQPFWLASALVLATALFSLRLQPRERPTQ